MSYINAAQYIARFGAVETTRITDDARSGTPDEDKVDDALSYASDLADSYLSGRYTVPIVAPPALLQGVVADIARMHLHQTRATQEIRDNFDRAVSYLKDLSAGRASLPTVANGAPPEENATGSAVTSNDGRPRVFTAANLDGFTGFPNRFGGTVFDGPANW